VVGSVVTLIGVAVKIALHERWIIKTAERFLAPAPQAPAPQVVAPVPVRVPVSLVAAPARMDRRNFLALMGTVGIASALAIRGALEGESPAPAEAAASIASLPSVTPTATASAVKTATAVPSVAPTATPTATVSASAQTGSALSPSVGTTSRQCVVRCNKGCSYPGRCRRYVDTNNNRRCDLGECW
jgi:hypothetical protein